MIGWITDDHTARFGHMLNTKDTMHVGRTACQSIEIYDSNQFLNLVVLDRNIVTTEVDAFAYYEMLVHVILQAHPHPEKILLVGSMSHLLYKEVAKHSDIQKIDHLILDESLLYHYEAVFQMHKVQVEFTETIEKITQVTEQAYYDVIIFDLPRNYEPNLAAKLIPTILSSLKETGLWNITLPSPLFDPSRYESFNSSIQENFVYYADYIAYVPTFSGGTACYRIGTNKGTIKKSIEKPVLFDTNYYTPSIHQAAFVLPRHLKE